ncbi:MAG: hypothetical protein OEV91_00785, partial [Desulfobulbaceae bacterium]|nr:hypothetical protein [Desulfobulbaceae bacterium]
PNPTVQATTSPCPPQKPVVTPCPPSPCTFFLSLRHHQPSIDIIEKNKNTTSSMNFFFHIAIIFLYR